VGEAGALRCFEYEEVELSNNLAENSMRPVALGRKNWLHVGSVKEHPNWAGRCPFS
jgi:transposase